MKIPAADIGRIRVKPTFYAGHYFRSRLEARWAVVFDAANIRWEYEPEKYELPDGSVYIPDFFLPVPRVFAEVKPDGGDFSKALAFYSHWQASDKGGFSGLLLLEGTPETIPYRIHTGLFNEDGEIIMVKEFPAAAIDAAHSIRFEDLASRRFSSYY